MRAGPIWATIDPSVSARRIHGCSRCSSSGETDGKFTALRTRPSRRKSRTVAAVSRPTSSCASSVDAAMWGVATTWGSFASVQSLGGSVLKTSRPAPPTMPASIARCSAASSISSPRAVLIRRIPGLHVANRSSLNRCLVCGVDGMWSVT